MSRVNPTARQVAWVALAVGLMYAALSAYWGLGGTWLLDTVGGEIGRQARDGGALILIALWVAVALKILAAMLPLRFCRATAVRSTPPVVSRRGWVRVLVWLEATILGLLRRPLDRRGLADPSRADRTLRPR